jgi:hypothetical protein
MPMLETRSVCPSALTSNTEVERVRTVEVDRLRVRAGARITFTHDVVDGDVADDGPSGSRFAACCAFAMLLALPAPSRAMWLSDEIRTGRAERAGDDRKHERRRDVKLAYAPVWPVGEY